MHEILRPRTGNQNDVGTVTLTVRFDSPSLSTVEGSEASPKAGEAKGLPGVQKLVEAKRRSRPAGLLHAYPKGGMYSLSYR